MVAALAVIGGAHANRHRQMQIANRDVVHLVVQPQATGDPGHEGVVERTTTVMRGLLQLRQRHLVHTEFAHQSAFGHQR